MGIAYGSGTMPAAGYNIIAAVTAAPLATALTANGATNFATQCTRGSGAVSGFVDTNKTIPSGSSWMILGGQTNLANVATTGPGFSVDVRHRGFIIQPTFAFCWQAFGDTTGTVKYVMTVTWDELDADIV